MYLISVLMKQDLGNYVLEIIINVLIFILLKQDLGTYGETSQNNVSIFYIGDYLFFNFWL